LTEIEDPTLPLVQTPPETTDPDDLEPDEPVDEDDENDEDEDEPFIMTIPDPDIPRAPFSDGKSWSLMNLILSIAGAVQALMIGSHVLMMKRKEREGAIGIINKALDLKKFALAIATPVFAISGLVTFILTQDMRLPMSLVDWWTPANAAMFYGGAQCYILTVRIGRDDDSGQGPLGAQA